MAHRCNRLHLKDKVLKSGMGIGDLMKAVYRLGFTPEICPRKNGEFPMIWNSLTFYCIIELIKKFLNFLLKMVSGGVSII